MDPRQVADAFRDVDPGIFVIPPRILRRVIKRHGNLPGIGLDVPHAHAYVIPRDDLFRYADARELGDARLSRAAASSLPDTLILLPTPELGTADPTALWRHAFHGAVHRAFDRLVAKGALTGAAIRARVHRVGQTEFDEIRVVLRQDHQLLPPHDDLHTYAEFAATYLELRAFSPDLLAKTFPALADHATLDRTLAMDLDRDALLAGCRPYGAPTVQALLTKAEEVARDSMAHAAHDEDEEDEPIQESSAPRPPRTSRASASEDVASLLPDAAAARAKGNLVRAMLLRTRAVAAGVAKEGATAELSLLLERLATALDWKDAPVARWAETMLPLVEAAPSASRLPWNTEARLLYDLQNACIDHERESYTVDFITWIRSAFKRPLRRTLPSRREVRVVKRLRAAQKKMPRTYVVEPQRSAIAHLVREWVLRAEQNLRARLRPKIEAAFAEVSLRPDSIPEEVAANKVVGELVDLVVERGFISLPQLRDALSRNNLKMQNLRLRELFVGDAILRADTALSIRIDGVYRRGEIYLRGLQKVSSVVSGTRAGREVSLYVILPLLAAFVGIEGFQHILEALLHYVFQVPEEHLHFEMLDWWSFAATAVVVFLLIHVPLARGIALALARFVGSVISGILYRIPRWILTRPAVQRVVKSGPSLFLYRLLVKPLAIAALGLPILLRLRLDRDVLLGVFVGAFVLWAVLLNTRTGARAQEALGDFTMRQWRELSRRILPGLGALLIAFFRAFVDGVDRMIYAVDEYLRFHKGENPIAVGVKAVLGLVWFFLTYVIRIYVNLLIEPQVNPIKHFPVVTVAAKIMIPMMKQTQAAMSHALEGAVGRSVARGIAWPTTFFLPGFWGFLVWEFKENFRLYKMNRRKNIAPVPIGHHGESMARYLKPGLHSGTIPKLWAKLRRASTKGARSAMKHRHTLHHVEETIRHFVERDLIALLERSPAWGGDALSVARITVASNRVRIYLTGSAAKRDAACIAFEEQSGWLVAGIAKAGFLDGLTDARRATFETALAGFYKMADVDFVREQIAACLGGTDAPPYDVSDDGIVVWPDGDYATEVVYALSSKGSMLEPHVRGAAPAKLPPPIDRVRLFFRDAPIAWSAWVLAWSSPGTPRVHDGPSLLPPIADRPVRGPDEARMIAE